MRLQSQRTRISATIPVAASLFVMAFAAPANAESGALIRKLAVTGTKLGIERPLGLAYRPDQDVFVIPDGPKMTLMSRRSVAGVVAERVPNPGAVAWDARSSRTHGPSWRFQRARTADWIPRTARV
jgi:hypothetical protein